MVALLAVLAALLDLLEAFTCSMLLEDGLGIGDIDDAEASKNHYENHHNDATQVAADHHVAASQSRDHELNWVAEAGLPTNTPCWFLELLALWWHRQLIPRRDLNVKLQARRTWPCRCPSATLEAPGGKAQGQTATQVVCAAPAAQIAAYEQWTNFAGVRDFLLIRKVDWPLIEHDRPFVLSKGLPPHLLVLVSEVELVV